jgi:hypothetical protein
MKLRPKNLLGNRRTADTANLSNDSGLAEINVASMICFNGPKTALKNKSRWAKESLRQKPDGWLDAAPAPWVPKTS